MSDDRSPRSRREILGLSAALVAGCSGAPEAARTTSSGPKTGRTTATTDAPSTSSTTTDDPPSGGTPTGTPGGRIAGDLGSWTMFGYDLANTGYNPEATGPDSDPKRVWETDVKGVYTMAQPTLSGGGVFVASGRRAYGMGARAGGIEWISDVPYLAHHYPVAVADGTLYVTARTLVGARTGGGSGVIVAVDAAEGTTDWTVETPVTTPPIPADGDVYVGSSTASRARIHRIAPDGTERWRVAFDPDGKRTTVRGAPALDDDRVYVSVTDAEGEERGFVAALDRRDGSEIWRAPLQSPVSAAPVRSGEVLYAGTEGGHLTAIDRSTGKREWTHDTGSRIFTTPVTDGKGIYCLLEGTVLAVDPSGNERWRTEVGSILINGLALTGDTVYVGGKSVTAIETGSGSIAWDFPIPSDAGGGYGAPVVLGSTVFVGACVKTTAKSRYDDAVYALQ